MESRGCIQSGCQPMEVLDSYNLRFEGTINPGASHLVHEKLRSFSHAFSYGKSHLLDSGLGEGGWALSWILGGILDPDFGEITRNDLNYAVEERRKDAWCVRHDRIKVRRFSFREPTVREQIQYGLKTVSGQYLKSEQEVMERFHLTAERYVRPLRQLSHEAWRASCAIGLVNGKRVFCFPYMDPGFIEDYYKIWLKEMLDLLTDSGALVLFPARAKKAAQGLCDEIVPVG